MELRKLADTVSPGGWSNSTCRLKWAECKTADQIDFGSSANLPLSEFSASDVRMNKISLAEFVLPV